MKLTFALPAPALSAYVSLYYYVDFDYARIEDIERADVGYLRFMFSGSGVYHYADGHNDRSTDIMLIGPSTMVAPYRLTGPMRCFGCVLLPRFWGGIVDQRATAFANRASDACPVFGPEILTLFGRLAAMSTIDAMARAMDDFLLPKLTPLRSEDIAVIIEIGKWLSQQPMAAPEALYAACNLSSRQVMRLSNQYYGAPPKLLSRKFRALRTASQIIGSKGSIPDALADEYADKSHMIREIKQFTGLTPRQLQVNSNPLMQASLHPQTFRTQPPWL